MHGIREGNAVRLPITEEGGATVAQRHKVAALQQRMLDRERCLADDGGQAQVVLLISTQRLPEGRRHTITGDQVIRLRAGPILEEGINPLSTLPVACTMPAK
jgi:hypothetical protein